MTKTNPIDLESIVGHVANISVQAGDEILRYYKSDYSVRNKSNNSPVTEADIAANEIIVSSLAKLTPEIPIISEESDIADYSVRSHWQRYWLIDPLDGTRSFVQGTDEFTVNIALIESQYPILGVVHSPIEQSTYWGAVGVGAYRSFADFDEPASIKTGQLNNSYIRMLISRSGMNNGVEAFKRNLEADSFTCEVLRSSSSIKFCRAAEGTVDVFLRFGTTSEWDTAAGQCVLECAGGSVIDLDNNRLKYNKADAKLRNPKFLAIGSGGLDWQRYLPDQ